MRVLAGALATLLIAAVVAVALAYDGESTASRAALLPTPTSPAATPIAEVPDPPKWVELSPGQPVTNDRYHYAVDVQQHRVWALEGGFSGPTGPDILGWSPQAEALVSVRSLERSIVYLSIPGREFRKLGMYEGSVGAASWPPGGEVIALEGVGLVDPLTGEIVSSEPSAGEVTWSGDGRYLGVADHNVFAPHVLIMDGDLNVVGDLPVFSAVWSNTGHRLAYVSPYSRSIGGPGPWNLVVRDLADGTEEVLRSGERAYAGVHSWSLDDRFLAISLRTDDPNDGGETRIVDSTGRATDVIIKSAWPGGWLIEGDALLMTGNVCSNFEVFTVRSNGDSLTNHTDSAATDWFPKASPDGRYLSFASVAPRGPATLRLVEVVTGQSRDVLSTASVGIPGELILSQIGWSPDGRFLAVSVNGEYFSCSAGEPGEPTTVELAP